MIYFAHSLEAYGTRAARDALERIRRLVPHSRILNPENLDWAALEKTWGRVGVYHYVIWRSARVVVLEHGGHLGRGAALECELALKAGKPVHVLRGRELLAVAGIRRTRHGDWSRFARVRLRGPGLAEAKIFPLSVLPKSRPPRGHGAGGVPSPSLAPPL